MKKRLSILLALMLAPVLALGVTSKVNKAEALIEDEVLEQLEAKNLEAITYCESTGEQYIQLDYVPNQDTRVVCDYADYSKSNGGKEAGYFALFGSRVSYNSRGFSFYPYTNNELFFNYGSVYAYSGSTKRYVEGERNVVDFDKNTASVNSVPCFSTTKTTFTAPAGLVLFGCYMEQDKPYGVKGINFCKIYSCQVYDNGTKVLDLIPARDKTSKVVGLYDSLGDDFYTSNTDVGFVYKDSEEPDTPDTPVVPETLEELPTVPETIEGYTMIKYLASTGTQYIDTGLRPTSKTAVSIIFEDYGEDSGACGLFGARETYSNADSLALYPYWGTFGIFYQYGAKYDGFGTYGAGLKTEVLVNGKDIYIDGKLASGNNRGNGSLADATFTCQRNLTIFGCNEKKGVSCTTANVYKCAVWENNVLQKYYIPVQNNTSKEYGMYDLVNEEFVGSANETPFYYKNAPIPQEDLANKTHRFSVGVDVSKYDPTVESKNWIDYGVLMFPASYVPEGKPTRLVIVCHGAGGIVDVNSSQMEGVNYAKLLCANGYAIMDVNGLPKEYYTLKGLDSRNNIGSPIAVECYEKAYQYAMEHFNFYPEVFISGGSMGGISSTNIVINGNIPVIAHMAFCPVLDTYNEIFLHPWTGGAPKVVEQYIYGFEKDDKGNYIYDENKIGSYNPANWIKTHKYPVPVLYAQRQSDPTVDTQYTRQFIANAKANGSIAYLYELSGTGHDPETCGTPISGTQWKTTYRGASLTMYPSNFAMLNWFASFEKGDWKSNMVEDAGEFYISKTDKWLNINKMFNGFEAIKNISFASMTLLPFERVIDISSLDTGTYEMTITLEDDSEVKKSIHVCDSRYVPTSSLSSAQASLLEDVNPLASLVINYSKNEGEGVSLSNKFTTNSIKIRFAIRISKEQYDSLVDIDSSLEGDGVTFGFEVRDALGLSRKKVNQNVSNIAKLDSDGNEIASDDLLTEVATYQFSIVISGLENVLTSLNAAREFEVSAYALVGANADKIYTAQRLISINEVLNTYLSDESLSQYAEYLDWLRTVSLRQYKGAEEDE